MKSDPKGTHLAKDLKYEAPLINCRFDPGGVHVFATAEDRAIVRWHLDSGERVVFPKEHDSWVRGLAFSKDGKTLVSSGYDDTLIWWSATEKDPKPLRKLAAHKGWIRAVAVSPDGSLLASAGNDRVVRVWKMEDGSPVRELPGHERDVYSLLFHPNGQWLLSGDLKGVVKQWDVNAGKLMRTFDAKALNTYNGGQQVDYGGVRALALNGDQSQLACAGLHKATNPLGAISKPLFLRFDWEKQKLLRSHVTDGVDGIGWNTCFHPDGYLLGCAGGKSGAWLLFWNGEDDKSFHKFKLPGTARECDLHPDGIQVAVALYEKKLSLCRLEPKVAAKK